MELRFLGRSYTRNTQSGVDAAPQFTGHFRGAAYRAPYIDSAQLKKQWN